MQKLFLLHKWLLKRIKFASGQLNLGVSTSFWQQKSNLTSKCLDFVLLIAIQDRFAILINHKICSKDSHTHTHQHTHTRKHTHANTHTQTHTRSHTEIHTHTEQILIMHLRKFFGIKEYETFFFEAFISVFKVFQL